MQALAYAASSVAPILSAFARQTVPGRIFIECKSLQGVVGAVTGVQQLYTNDVKLVALENMTNVLSMRCVPRPRPQEWVRILGNTKKLRPYKGDIALVVESTNSNLLQLWLVPRQPMETTDETLDPPLARLLPPKRPEARPSGEHLREGKTALEYLSAQGYLVLSKQEMHMCQAGEVVPTVEELRPFLGCEALLAETLTKTRQRIGEAQLALHDRVKFVTGTFRGLLGKVVNLAGGEVDVFLPSQGVIERTRASEVVKHFRVGDRVRVRAGKGEAGVDAIKLGWVTEVGTSEVAVFDAADGTEVSKKPHELHSQ